MNHLLLLENAVLSLLFILVVLFLVLKVLLTDFLLPLMVLLFDADHFFFVLVVVRQSLQLAADVAILKRQALLLNAAPLFLKPRIIDLVEFPFELQVEPVAISRLQKLLRFEVGFLLHAFAWRLDILRHK